MANVTIHDVAREAGVSIATVSYVLNNPRRVGEEARKRVLLAVQRLGYRPNITARNLQAGETRLLGYSWRPSPPDQFNPILDRFLHAMAEAAAAHGYRVLVFPTPSLEAELATYEEMILIGQVDGFVLSNTNLNDVRVRSLLDTGFPFVSFGRANCDWDFPWVDVDGTEGVRQATAHLIQQGHRHIACLAWPEDSLTGRYRLQGYRDAMSQAGLCIEAEWIVVAENTHADAYAKARNLLALPPDRRPTAIVTMSDLMAMGVINAGWDAGLEVGRELAVVGFDDVPVARFLRPSLTSVSQPLDQVGERLISMLVDLIKGRELAARQVLLPPHLVVRDSTARPLANHSRATRLGEDDHHTILREHGEPESDHL